MISTTNDLTIYLCGHNHQLAVIAPHGWDQDHKRLVLLEVARPWKGATPTLWLASCPCGTPAKKRSNFKKPRLDALMATFMIGGWDAVRVLEPRLVLAQLQRMPYDQERLGYAQIPPSDPLAYWPTASVR